jgi:hypothetical protein
MTGPVRESCWFPRRQILKTGFFPLKSLRACSKSGIVVLQTPQFYLAGPKEALNNSIENYSVLLYYDFSQFSAGKRDK